MMALTDEEIKRIKSGIENFSNQDLDIPDNEKEDFWNWFKQNASLYRPTSLDNIENVNLKGRCFDVAQKIYKLKNKDYYEGFYELNNEIIFHGFNIENNNVEDYTIKRETNLGKVPEKYYGIKILEDLIDSENLIYIENDEINIPFLIYKNFKRNI